MPFNVEEYSKFMYYRYNTLYWFINTYNKNNRFRMMIIITDLDDLTIHWDEDNKIWLGMMIIIIDSYGFKNAPLHAANLAHNGHSY